MDLMSASDAVRWAAARGICLEPNAERCAFDARLSAKVHRIEIASDFGAANDTLASLMTVLPAHPDGGLIWLYSDGGEFERAARKIVLQLLRSYGVTDMLWLESGSFHKGLLFDEGEFDDAHMFLTLCFIFGWRAAYVPAGGRMLIRTYDSEWIYFSAADERTLQQFLPLLEAYDAKVVNA